MQFLLIQTVLLLEVKTVVKYKYKNEDKNLRDVEQECEGGFYLASIMKYQALDIGI